MSEPLDTQHGEWDALAVGWALSALDPHDEARFAVHLPTCPRCTETVREALRTVSDLAYAVPDDAPPAGLKQRIMLAAAAEPRQASPGADSVDSVDSAGSAGSLRTPDSVPDAGRAEPVRFRRVAEAPPVEPPAAAGVPEPRRRHAASDPGDRPARVVPLEPRRRRWAAAVASAAAVMLIAALGAWNLQLRADRDDLRGVVAQREAAISQLTADGPARVAAVQAVNSDLQPQATRRATIVVQNGRTTIIVEALTPRTGDETYWLWTLNCLGAVRNLKPITGFQVATRGFSVRNVGSQPGLATTQCFALSAERTPGTPTKPDRVVAVGPLR